MSGRLTEDDRSRPLQGAWNGILLASPFWVGLHLLAHKVAKLSLSEGEKELLAEFKDCKAKDSTIRFAIGHLTVTLSCEC